MSLIEIGINEIKKVVCNFLKRKYCIEDRIKVPINLEFRNYLSDNHLMNTSRYNGAPKLIKNHHLRRIFAHNLGPQGYNRIVEFSIRLVAQKPETIKNRTKEISIMGMPYISLKLKKKNFPRRIK